eukprot:GHVU01040213.1.p3 GENE.GHVU01040213.1~~GHVU01040213.1.p3  ORF type:complete len:107 (+),score=11.96 GHVU01040213.1:69-389(+)
MLVTMSRMVRDLVVEEVTARVDVILCVVVRDLGLADEEVMMVREEIGIVRLDQRKALAILVNSDTIISRLREAWQGVEGARVANLGERDSKEKDKWLLQMPVSQSL